MTLEGRPDVLELDVLPTLPIQLSRLMGQKEEVVPAGFPGLRIGLISTIRHEAGTSPERQEKFAVWRRQCFPFPLDDRCLSMAFEILSGPAADLHGNPLVYQLQR